mgnify:CR=1 FL=1
MERNGLISLTKDPLEWNELFGHKKNDISCNLLYLSIKYRNYNININLIYQKLLISVFKLNLRISKEALWKITLVHILNLHLSLNAPLNVKRFTEPSSKL